MNYCIIFDNQEIAIEIPVRHNQGLNNAKNYVRIMFPQFCKTDKDGGRELKENVDFTSVAKAMEWGYKILPLL